MGRARLVAVAAMVTTLAAGWTAGGAIAGAPTASIDVTASATCDGTVTATYEYQLFAERNLSAGLLTFTLGVSKVNVSLPDVPAGLDAQLVTDTVSQGGYAPGDVVIVDVTYTDSAEGVAAGVATVTVPECPVDTEAPTTDAPTTDAPTTDAPVETEAPSDTDAASPTEAPTETEPPVDATPSTLPSTGGETLPTGLVAGLLLFVGVALVVGTVRRGRTA